MATVVKQYTDYCAVLFYQSTSYVTFNDETIGDVGLLGVQKNATRAEWNKNRGFVGVNSPAMLCNIVTLGYNQLACHRYFVTFKDRFSRIGVLVVQSSGVQYPANYGGVATYHGDQSAYILTRSGIAHFQRLLSAIIVDSTRNLTVDEQQHNAYWRKINP